MLYGSLVITLEWGKISFVRIELSHCVIYWIIVQLSIFPAIFPIMVQS